MWIALLLYPARAHPLGFYGTIRRTISTHIVLFNDGTLPRLYAKFLGFIHFVPFFMEFQPFSLFHPHCDTTFTAHTHSLEHQLLWIQLFWMKKMKFYCIAYTKVWSEIKCMYCVLCIYIYGGYSWLVVCDEFMNFQVQIFAQFRCLCWYLPNINPLVAIGVFAFSLHEFYVKFN